MPSRLEAALGVRLDGLGLAPDDVLWRDALGGLAQPGQFSANRHCGWLRARDGWVALNLARPDDVELVMALSGRTGDVWAAASHLAGQVDARTFRAQAIEWQLPVALPGEATALDLAALEHTHVPRRVLDLSALWAGPLCASLLAQSGAHVLRIDSVGRPDPTVASSPVLDARLNGRKARLSLDLREPDGRQRLLDEVAASDVVITSARPAALARLGLVPARFCHVTWVAITAHGFGGDAGLRVGFGDDCAVAGGLFDARGDEPQFLGDALADPLTGLEAARAVLSGRTGLIDIAMARVAASYAAMMA